MIGYVCHDCGSWFTEEQDDLTCPNCGAARDQIETVEMVDPEAA